ncbi:MAG: ParB/RepB/Spo0J family partition protein [Spirochaetia bacterium]|nr:ParB/RepB/Spo0J family partition protein [Spirochaetia bacterium]
MAKRGLGKGISSLMGDYSMDSKLVSGDKLTYTDENNNSVVMLGVDKITSNPGQPRKYFDTNALQELADSIREQGVLQPILVEESPDVPGHFIIVAGERRFRASKLAELKHIPSLIKNFTEEQRLEVALIENLQRENLNPIEEAQAYRFLIDQASLSQDELSKRIGKKRSTIANSLRLLNLNDVMQKSLKEGVITAGHARALLAVINPADQEILYNKIVKDSLSVRQAEDEGKALNEGSRASKKKVKKNDKIERPADIRRIEEKFLGVLGTRVSLKGNLKKGKLEITFYSSDDLERLYQLLSKKDDLFD